MTLFARLISFLTLLYPHTVTSAQYYYYRQYGAANPFEAMRQHTLLDNTCLVDVDGDGDYDAVAVEFDRFRLAKNTGTAAAPVFAGLEAPFFQAVQLAAGSHAAFGKVDGDNDVDLVAGTEAGTFRYFSNTGSAFVMTLTELTGNANPFKTIDVGNYARPAIVDIDGDGDGDVVTGSLSNNQLILLRNTGTAGAPAFVQEAFAPFNAINVSSPIPAFVDMDGDSDLDLVINGTAFFTNTGTAAAPVYVRDTVTFTPSGALEPAIADINQDGKPELVSFSSFAYLTQGPPPQPSPFTEDNTLTNALTARDFNVAASGDVDGDGDFDLLISGECTTGLRFVRNNGTATAPVWNAWSPAPEFPGLESAASAAMADVDGDGDFDVLVWGNPTWKFYRNTGTRTAPAFVQETGAADPFNLPMEDNYAAAFGDLDGDGDLDFVSGHGGGEVSMAVKYFENTGSATAPAYVQRTGAANPFHITSWMESAAPTLADMDGDGDLDALIGGWSQLIYLRNDGTRFAPSFTLESGAASPFIGISLAFTYFHPLGGEWRNGGRADLILGMLRSEQGCSARFFTGKSDPAGFSAWQSANFTLPAEAALAAADADPDKDGVVNLIEYAVKTPPKIAGGRPGTVTRTGTGILQLVLDVRDDDPGLSAVGQSGSSAAALSGSLAPVITDPVANDGVKRWTFTDQPPAGNHVRRFLRARFSLN